MKPMRIERDPRRWRESQVEGANAAPDEQRIGSLLRRVPPPAPLAPTQFRAVAQRLQTRAGRGMSARLRRRRWAVIVALVAGTSGVVFAQRQLARVLRERRAAEIVMTTTATATSAAASPAVAMPLPIAPVTAPAKEIALVAPSAPTSRSGPKLRPRAAREQRAPVARTLALRDPDAEPASIPPPAPVVPPAPTSRSRTALLPEPDHSRLPLLSNLGTSSSARPRDGRLAQESTLLREALQSLRHDDDARGALDTLDEYDQRFPFGVLRPNAALVRIDATLALGRRDEALRLLEQIDLLQSPRRDELEVTRAELRSPGDCRAALPDFSAVLARDPMAAIAERALRGRARCQITLGHDDDARADLQTYLARFPQGALAAEARRRLRR
jgi:hypothetical protein